VRSSLAGKLKFSMGLHEWIAITQQHALGRPAFALSSDKIIIKNHFISLDRAFCDPYHRASSIGINPRTLPTPAKLMRACAASMATQSSDFRHQPVW
jgi:hypothetical protein